MKRRKGERAWFGNQYYDIKDGKWKDGEKSKRVKLRDVRLWLVLLFCILGSLAITLVLNYFNPGASFIFVVF